MRTAFDRRVRRPRLTRSQWLLIKRLHPRSCPNPSEHSAILEVDKVSGWRTVGTEDAFVEADIAQIAPEVAGRVAQVLVRDHERVEAGAPLLKIDPVPFRLVLDKAEAELDNARTTVETARAQWLETQSELAEVESQADYLARQATRQQALAATGAASPSKLDEALNAATVARDRVGVVKKRLARMLAALGGNPE